MSPRLENDGDEDGCLTSVYNTFFGDPRLLGTKGYMWFKPKKESIEAPKEEWEFHWDKVPVALDIDKFEKTLLPEANELCIDEDYWTTGPDVIKMRTALDSSWVKTVNLHLSGQNLKVEMVGEASEPGFEREKSVLLMRFFDARFGH